MSSKQLISNPNDRRASEKLTSAIFVTFSGNCKKALSFYQTCFGGHLHFETFETQMPGYIEKPVISGALISDRIAIYGSDLVHNEGRKLGNYISVFLQFKNSTERNLLIEKLVHNNTNTSVSNNVSQKLVEITDAFDVRWILAI